MTLDYNRLEEYLMRADPGKCEGFDHPSQMEEPIGKQGQTKRFISTSSRTNGTTILTPLKYANMLHAHDAPPGLLEKTEQGWLFKSIKSNGKVIDLEYRALLLDNGEMHTQNWWHNDYKQTREGQQGWRLPTTEEAIEMFYRLLVLDKTHYHNDVQLLLNGDQPNHIIGLRAPLAEYGIVLADRFVRRRKDQSVIITNPLGKKITITQYPKNDLVLAPVQHEGLLGTQVTPDNAAWLEALVGEKWTQLPQILQFIAPRVQQQAPESFGQEQESHLRNASIIIRDQIFKQQCKGRVVLTCGRAHDYGHPIGIDVGGYGRALGVRSVR